MTVLPELKGRDYVGIAGDSCGGSAVPRHSARHIAKRPGLPILQAGHDRNQSDCCGVHNSQAVDRLPSDDEQGSAHHRRQIVLGVDCRVVEPA